MCEVSHVLSSTLARQGVHGVTRWSVGSLPPHNKSLLVSCSCNMMLAQLRGTLFISHVYICMHIIYTCSVRAVACVWLIFFYIRNITLVQVMKNNGKCTCTNLFGMEELPDLFSPVKLEVFKQYLPRADLNPVTLVMQGVQATKVCGASLQMVFQLTPIA